LLGRLGQAQSASLLGQSRWRFEGVPAGRVLPRSLIVSYLLSDRRRSSWARSCSSACSAKRSYSRMILSNRALVSSSYVRSATNRVSSARSRQCLGLASSDSMVVRVSLQTPTTYCASLRSAWPDNANISRLCWRRSVRPSRATNGLVRTSGGPRSRAGRRLVRAARIINC